MKVKVIGTGSMWTKYNSASYLIDEDVLVDCPNGCSKYLYKLGIVPKSVENILITHFHGDHYFDIPFYILNKSKSDNKRVNIYCGKEGSKKIKKLGVLAFPNSFLNACKEINLNFCNKNEFKVSKYDIKRVLVDHGRMKPAYGYIFKKDNVLVGFTGDTSLCESVKDMASKCSYLFCDCMRTKGNEKHMGVDNLLYLANEYPSCNFVPSHMDDETREELLNLNVSNIIVVSDGYVFEI